jgi:hypothetical protein
VTYGARPLRSQPVPAMTKDSGTIPALASEPPPPNPPKA